MQGSFGGSKAEVTLKLRVKFSRWFMVISLYSGGWPDIGGELRYIGLGFCRPRYYVFKIGRRSGL